MKKKTVSIEIHSISGTMDKMIHAIYKGRILSHTEHNPHLMFVYASCRYDGQESIEAMKTHARRHGFTHYKLIGPEGEKGGAL